MSVIIGGITVFIQSRQKIKKSHIKTYSKSKIILITSFVSFGLFMCCFVFVFKSGDYYDIIESNIKNGSFGDEYSQSENERPPFNESSNIVNGGLGCFDGSTYFFSDQYLWSEDSTGEKINIVYDKKVYYLNSVEKYLYFVSPTENHAICRIKKDGTDFKKIYDNYSNVNYCYELTYYNGWLYFSSNLGGSDYHICRMRLDGSDLTVLADCWIWYMTIYNSKIIFCNYDDGKSICSMNTDGSGYKVLRSGECSDLCVVDNKIYFSTDMKNRKLHKIDFDGNNEEVIIDSYTRNTNYYDKKLYFVNSQGEICCCDLNGGNLCVLFNDLISYSYITLLPEKICGYDSNNDKLIVYDYVNIP